ncbi:MAG: VOC family protein [Hyphomonadaceae bacterium]|nr:VOC family protein [Hyphomonadaceae bacterium]
MIKKVAFTMLHMTDVPRARKFYEETLGLKIGSHGNHGDNWWIEYDLPQGGCIGLSNFDREAPTGKGSVLAVEVEDLDALIAHLNAHGVAIKGDIVHGPHCRMAMCQDSEGNPLLLHQLSS